MFSVRGLRLYFPHWNLGFTVCLPSCSSRFICTRMWDRCSTSHCLPQSGPPAASLSRVLSTQLPIFTSPTSLDECFFFNSLVVGLPYSSIFWQFQYFACKFVVVLPLVVRGGTMCLPMPPSFFLPLSPPTSSFSSLILFLIHTHKRTQSWI